MVDIKYRINVDTSEALSMAEELWDTISEDVLMQKVSDAVKYTYEIV